MALRSKRIMEADDVHVSYCPSCTKAVPDWADKCQFCGTPIVHGGGASGGVVPTRRGGDRPVLKIATRTWFVYYACAMLLVLGGVYEALAATYMIGAATGESGFPIALVLGAATAMFGVFAFFDLPAVRRLAPSASALRFLASALLLAGWIFGKVAAGPSTPVFLALSAGFVLVSLVMATVALPIASASRSS